MLCDYFAGWVSGVLALAIGHPFDTIKTQQQVVGITFTQAFSRISKHRGWKGFYRGLLVPVLTNGTLNAIFFGVFGDVRDYLIKKRSEREWAQSFGNHASDRQRPMLENDRRMALAGFEETNPERLSKKYHKEPKFSELFISGAVAGTSCLFLGVPAELVTTKLQSQMRRKEFSGPIHAFTKIVKESGFRGIYRGIMPMTLKECLAGGSYLTIYETAKKHAREQKSAFGSLVMQMIGGGLAGVATWTLILPFDTIKSRMQADDHLNPKYKNMAHCAKTILKTDGIIGLYRGFLPCIARAVPVNVIIFVVYEMIQERICQK